MALRRGLYQSLITESLRADLDALQENLRAKYRDLHHSDVADQIATHVSHIVERVINAIADGDRVASGVALARELIHHAVDRTAPELISQQPAVPGQFLT